MVEVATSNRSGGDSFTRKYIWIKVTRNFNQYPLHHVTYSATNFEVATSNALGVDTPSRNVMDGRTNSRMDDGPTLVRFF